MILIIHTTQISSTTVAMNYVSFPNRVDHFFTFRLYFEDQAHVFGLGLHDKYCKLIFVQYIKILEVESSQSWSSTAQSNYITAQSLSP